MTNTRAVRWWLAHLLQLSGGFIVVAYWRITTLAKMHDVMLSSIILKMTPSQMQTQFARANK